MHCPFVQRDNCLYYFKRVVHDDLSFEEPRSQSSSSCLVLHYYDLVLDKEAVVERDEHVDYRIPEPEGPEQVLFAKPFGELYVCYFIVKNNRGASHQKVLTAINEKIIKVRGK